MDDSYFIKEIRTAHKPWGKEEVIEENNRYVVKRLFMVEEAKCSLQYHKKKHETIVVEAGKLRVYVGKDKDSLSKRVLEAGEFVIIPPMTVHRMEGVTDCIYLESSTPELDDVVRVEDDYGRV